MAQRGKASMAHEYNEHEVCIHCGMYKVNVDRMIHVCKPARELEVDQKAADAAGVDLATYRSGVTDGQ